jgi:hypothetical protein
VARKVITKVVLSKEQKVILNQLKIRHGTSESETMRMALMDYAKEVNMLSEIIQGKRQSSEENTEK